MIIKVENLTATAITSLDLLANEIKVIFYNKTFWVKSERIYKNLTTNKIRFLDENNAPVVYKNPLFDNNKNEELVGEEILGRYLSVFESTKKDTTELKNNIEDLIGSDIYRFIKNLFRTEPHVGVNADSLTTTLHGTKLSTVLKFAEFKKAGLIISQLPDDEFFTTDHKSRIKEICDSVSL
jgi:hypothetical protein